MSVLMSRNSDGSGGSSSSAPYIYRADLSLENYNGGDSSAYNLNAMYGNNLQDFVIVIYGMTTDEDLYSRYSHDTSDANVTFTFTTSSGTFTVHCSSVNGVDKMSVVSGSNVYTNISANFKVRMWVYGSSYVTALEISSVANAWPLSSINSISSFKEFYATIINQ